MKDCHSRIPAEGAPPQRPHEAIPTAVTRKKRGEPVFGDQLVVTRFTWDYWCDICGKRLVDKDAIYRPATNGRQAGGWCKECALAYDFLDLNPSVRTSRDPDEIHKLYHFTDSRKIDSIEQLGLLAMDELDRLDISAHLSSTASSRRSDRRDGLSGFVRLALHPHHPMAWKALFDRRTPELAWLEVDTSVLDDPATLFSDTNALTEGRTIGSNHLVATRGTDQAEAMVKSVPTRAIVGTVRTASV